MKFIELNKETPPVIIGGVGGSGTRVIAELLSKIGYYIGNDLNNASDNLLYTLIFKRPNWFRKTLEILKKFSVVLNFFTN